MEKSPGILDQIETSTYTGDISVEDLEGLLTDMLAKPRTPPLIQCGVDFVMTMDDQTFIGWTEGLLPQVKVTCGVAGLKLLQNRKNKLIAKRKEQNEMP